MYFTDVFIFMDTGFNTVLKSTFGIKTAKHVSDNLEGLLTAVEKSSPRRLSDADALNAQIRK